MIFSSNSIGETLKRLRKTNGLTQGDVANALNIDRTTYTYYEKGRTPSLEMLKKLSLIFNVTLSELIDEGEYAEKIRIASDESESKTRDLYLSPEEKQLIMRFRLCGDEDKRKIMDDIIDLAVKEDF